MDDQLRRDVRMLKWEIVLTLIGMWVLVLKAFLHV